MPGSYENPYGQATHISALYRRHYCRGSAPRSLCFGSLTLLYILPLLLPLLLLFPHQCLSLHRLGSLIDIGVPVVVGPNSGQPETEEDTWIHNFYSDVWAGGVKYVVLKFASNIKGNDYVEIRTLDDNVLDSYNVDDGPDGTNFWTVPFKGNAVRIAYVHVDGSDDAGVTLSKYGRGEEIDIFQVDPPYQEPMTWLSLGTCDTPSQFNPDAPSWVNVECMDASTMKTVSNSVGMLVFATDEDSNPDKHKLTSCSGTLIDTNLVLTAGHCIAGNGSTERISASFTLDFFTECDGSKPVPYAPRFYKVIETVKSGFARPAWDTRTPLDYTILKIDPAIAELGVSSIDVETVPPLVGNDIFIIHHPRGTAKKVSNQETEEGTCEIEFVDSNTIDHGCDIDNGSSGSSSFDLSGKIVALNNWAARGCAGHSLLVREIWDDYLNEPEPPVPVDVMMALDISGSMNLEGESGENKIFEAVQAAAMFIDLLRTGASHNVGLISFSSTAKLEHNLLPVTEGNKKQLIGNDPYSSVEGKLGVLEPWGSTSIGAGLQLSQAQLSVSSTNRPIILLMTDGMQNTEPLIEDVDIDDTKICAIGFGTEGSLDGPLLTSIASNSGGLYTRAGDGLELKKFFALCFGIIFESGIALDPPYTILKNQTQSVDIPISICGESDLTIIIGWNRTETDLRIELDSPGGASTYSSTTSGIESSVGQTWAYLRLSLPFDGHHAGVWKARAVVPPPVIPKRQRWRNRRRLYSRPYDDTFILSAVIDGGPLLRPIQPPRRVYTGDRINPVVYLRQPEGTFVAASSAVVHVESPNDGAGERLMGLVSLGAGTKDGDNLSARTNDLIFIESSSANLIPMIESTFDLTGFHDNVLEEDGMYSMPDGGVEALYEGMHTFRVVATYGDDGCVGTRETMWSVHVSVGVDPENTEVLIDVGDANSAGDCFDVTVNLIPRDKYGSALGPGQLSLFDVASVPAVTVDAGSLHDNGHGSYSAMALWCPLDGGGDVPGIAIVQPDRPVTVVPFDVPDDLIPICTYARANPDSCWPPNHKFVTVEVVNVATFDGVGAVIEINYVSHDEERRRTAVKDVGAGATSQGMRREKTRGKETGVVESYEGKVKGGGDGNTDTDYILKGAKAMVRCERSGQGDGRDYIIGFTARNSYGASCQGQVVVHVPKSQKDQK